jgi:hypothetical protein
MLSSGLARLGMSGTEVEVRADADPEDVMELIEPIQMQVLLHTNFSACLPSRDPFAVGKVLEHVRLEEDCHSEASLMVLQASSSSTCIEKRVVRPLQASVQCGIRAESTNASKKFGHFCMHKD